MRERSRWVAALVMPMALITAACSENSGSPTVAGSFQLNQSTLVTAEPATITPRFVSDPFCGGALSFLALLRVTIGSHEDVWLGRVGFDFLDGSGVRTFPTAVPIPSSGSTIPTSTPVPIPSASPIPVPGHVPFGGVLIPGGQPRTQSFSLNFGCGVRPAGTLFLVIETTDRRGKAHKTGSSVLVGR